MRNTLDILGGSLTVLVPMTPDAYCDYLEAAVVAYARDNVASGRWPQVGSLERSRGDFNALLPLGTKTPDNFLFEVRSDPDGDVVGSAWIAIERKPTETSAFLYDLKIAAAHRREGHALRALEALDSFASSQGAVAVGLHVFAFNEAARALYAKAGYNVVSVNMRKEL